MRPPLSSRRVAHLAALGAALGATPSLLAAQGAAVVPHPDARLALRSVMARRIAGRAPLIDGRLDDDAWGGAAIATDFVESRPVPGGIPSLRTEARIAFDGEALYVAVRAFDPAPDSIVAPYPRRDDEITSDWLFVEIDSRHDRRSGFSFGLNPRGVQCDGAWFDDANYDGAWNAVWEGAARIDSLGWTAEYRIPFSQLALPARRGAEATFGLNVYRRSPRRGETSNWSPRLPTLTGVVSHFNELRGLVLPPTVSRLDLVPYAAVRTADAPPAAGDAASAALPRGRTVLGGADARLRLAPALTLAATVHPDFGQVEADPAVVNLTAFETFFPEQRPFFVDDADRFAFDGVASALPGAAPAAGLGLPFHVRDLDFSQDAPFYSRRIGRPPHVDALGGDRLVSAPATTDILGAAKLTGRSDGGWSLGALGAATQPATAVIDDGAGARTRALVEPRTLFGVARVQREIGGGASAVGGLVTTVHRAGLDDGSPDPGRAALADRLPTDALLAAVDARHAFALGGDGRDWELSGFAAASRIAGTAAAIRSVEGDAAHALLRPDAAHLDRFARDSTRTALGGASVQLRAAKLSGHWTGSVIAHAISPGFTDDDVGFQQSTDWLLAVGTLGYQRFEPGRVFRQWSLALDQVGAGWSFGGERRGAAAGLAFSGALRNEWGGKLRVGRELPALSTDALHGALALRVPGQTTWDASVHTDARRTTVLTLTAAASREDATGAPALRFAPELDARLSDHLRVDLKPSVERVVDATHWVGASGDVAGCTTPAAPAGTCYVVGRLTQRTASLALRADLAFSARTTLQLWSQALVGAAAYDRFAAVVDPRAPRFADRARALDSLPSDLRDPSFATRRLRFNAVWRWEYRPGSTLYVVFTQQRAGDEPDGRWDAGAAVRALRRDPAASVLMVKWSWWWQP